MGRTQGHRGQTALAIGMACAVTALPILVLLMDDFGILHAPLGKRILRKLGNTPLFISAAFSTILFNCVTCCTRMA